MQVVLSVADVINSLSNDKALVLFKTIALANPNSDILISKIELTRKQYYSRMSSLIKSGLVKRQNGRYILTTFGKIVYNAQTIIEDGLNNYWKLKAIDSLGKSDDLPIEEWDKLINTLIDNQQIKEILSKRLE